jgi:DNA mismatch endonuclease (patch repair protein)
MARIRQKNTSPELKVRQVLHALGYRFRVNRRGLPGTPDIVFLSRRKAIFIHGCFWHRHPGCRKASTPKTRTEFWNAKFDANIKRDERKTKELEREGWDVMVVWECESASTDLPARFTSFLQSGPATAGTQ